MVSVFSVLVILIGRKRYIIILLISIYLVAYDVEHLFICLFVICISSLMRDLLRFWLIFKFLFYCFKDSLYILNDSPVSVVSFTKYFPLIYGLTFHSLDIVFFFGCTASGLLLPLSGTEPGPSAIRVQSPNRWIAGELPWHCLLQSLLTFLHG